MFGISTAKKLTAVALSAALVLSGAAFGAVYVSATGNSTMSFEGAEYTKFYTGSSAFQTNAEKAKAKLTTEDGGIGHNSDTAMRLSYLENASVETSSWRAAFGLYKSGDAYRVSKTAGKYYKVSMWVKVENLPVDGELLLEIAQAGYADGEPDQGRSVIRAIKRLPASSTAGEWMQVSGIVKQASDLGAWNPYLAVGLEVADHRNRKGASVLIDDIQVEEMDSAPVTVAFDTDGGDLLQTYQTGNNTLSTYTKALIEIYGEANAPLPSDAFRFGITPVKEGYAFGGWYADKEMTNYASTFPSESTTLYAKWYSSEFYQNYESFTAKTYADDNTDGIRGNGYGRTVSAEQNHTPGGSKSAKVDLINASDGSGGMLEYKPRTVLNFGGQHFKAEKGASYTVTFWAYVTKDCNLHYYLGSAAKSTVSACQIGQRNNAETPDKYEAVKGGEWRQFTITDEEVSGGSYNGTDWEEIYLTLNLYTGAANAEGEVYAYIDDVSIERIYISTVQDYEAFAAKTYADDNTDGIRGNGYGRTVSSEQNHTPGGSKSAKVDLYNNPAANLEYKPRTVLNFGGQHFKAEKGASYTVTFWAYVTKDCNFHYYLGSAAKSTVSACQIGQRNNAETPDKYQAVKGGEWKKYTITDSFVSGGSYNGTDWEEIYLTLNLYTGAANAEGEVYAYIDDVSIERVYLSTFQDYESFEAKNYDAFNTDGIHGNGFGREVSTEQNHTPGGSKSAKIKMNNDLLDVYGQTIVNLDGQDIQWRENTSYIISFWVMAADAESVPQDLTVTWRIASAGGPLDGIGNIHTIEKQGEADLKAGEWQQITVKINKATGLSGNRFMTIGGTFFAAGSPISSPKNDYKFTKYLYIDDVTVTPVYESSKITFHTDDSAVSVPSQNSFPGEAFGSLPVPRRSGYLFEGWYDLSGDVCYGNDSVMPAGSKGMDMYAHWISAPETACSFETGFEEDEYNHGVQPYVNDGEHTNIDAPQMTATATWLKDGGLSAETGDGAVTLVNRDPYVNDNGQRFHVFALVNADGTPFTVLKGAKYRISYSYMGDVVNNGNSYVFAVVSDSPANLGVGASDQVLKKNFILGATDWYRSEQMFEAEQTGYVYLALAARNNSYQYNSGGHVANIDNVKVEALDNSYVSVLFKNGGGTVAKLVGQAGTSIPMPAQPTKSNYAFTAWYTDAACTAKYDTQNYPAADTTLYAGFQAADYSQGASDFSTPIHLSFEETELLNTWLWSPLHMEWSEDSMSFVSNAPESARTGSNYVRFHEVENHWSNRYLMLYDPKSTHNVLYLEPQTTYKVTYWYRVSDDFKGIQINLNFSDPSSANESIVKAASYSCIAEDLKANEWTKVEQMVTTGNKRAALSFSTANALFTFDLDDVTVQKSREVTVHFMTNGGSEIDPVKVMTGTLLDVPDEPYRDGYSFAGWYTDAAFTKPFDFEASEVGDEMTLYAKWMADSADKTAGDTTNPQRDTDRSEDSRTPDTAGQETSETEAIGLGTRPEWLSPDPAEEKTPGNTTGGLPEKSFPWLVVGISAGAAILAAAGVVLVWILMKRRRNTRRHTPESSAGEE